MYQKSINLTVHIILFFLSLISILIYFFFNKKKRCIYLNENKTDIIENRSWWIYKKYKPDIIIVHSVHFFTSIKNFFFRKPSIYIESIYYIRSLISNQSSLDNKKTVCKYLFKFIKVKELYLLDDIRHIDPILYSAKKIGIKTICFMHGQIYENYEILFKNQPNVYLVWSSFFKNILINNFENKKNTNIKIIGFNNYDYSTLDTNLINRNILILEEDTIDYSLYFKLLSKINNCQFYFKPKKGLKSKKHKIPDFIKKINTNDNLFEIVSKFKINLILGFSSNALIECYLFNILSLSIAKNNELLSQYIRKHKHVMFLDSDNISEKIDYIFKNYKKLLQHYKTMVWD